MGRRTRQFHGLFASPFGTALRMPAAMARYSETGVRRLAPRQARSDAWQRALPRASLCRARFEGEGHNLVRRRVRGHLKPPSMGAVLGRPSPPATAWPKRFWSVIILQYSRATQFGYVIPSMFSSKVTFTGLAHILGQL